MLLCVGPFVSLVDGLRLSVEALVLRFVDLFDGFGGRCDYRGYSLCVLCQVFYCHGVFVLVVVHECFDDVLSLACREVDGVLGYRSYSLRVCFRLFWVAVAIELRSLVE